MRERVPERVQLSRHQRPGAGNERESRNSVRGRFRAMRGSESVVHVDVAKRGDFPGQSCVVFFLALVDPAVLQHDHVSWLDLHPIYPVGNQRNFNT